MTPRGKVRFYDARSQNLFGGLAPLHRRTDPPSSKEAAHKQVSSGRHDAQLVAVLHGVEEYPGRTSRELAELTEMDRYMVARRLPDLNKMSRVIRGRMRKCRAGNALAMVWWPWPKTGDGE